MTLAITRVTTTTLPVFEAGLRNLADALGDPYTCAHSTLAASVCGADAPCLGLLVARDGAPLGVLLGSPVFSTMLGGCGLYVSDLWVARGARGQGLSRRLLAHAQQTSAATFLKLAVYEDNPTARAVYDRLGFVAHPDQIAMIRTGTLTPKGET